MLNPTSPPLQAGSTRRSAAAPGLAAAAVQTLPILMYHSLDASASVVSVSPRDFAGQMRCVAELGLRGISLREAIAYRDAHHTWPARCVVLTFDDGYANTHEHGLPVLVREGFTATIFVVSGHVEGHNDWGPTPDRLGTRPMLSWKQAAELVAAGIEIGAHTQTHQDLTQLSALRAQEEIIASRLDLERRLGIRVDSFAYPFGNVSAASLAIVRREFRAACGTVLKRVRDDHVHTLPRIDAYYLQSRDRLEQLLTGRLDRYLAVRRWGRRVRRMLIREARPQHASAPRSTHGRNTPPGRDRRGSS
jgi:peptidoglycan/xylan/chitin deacetylase (PgdA/CDA1 family)